MSYLVFVLDTLYTPRLLPFLQRLYYNSLGQGKRTEETCRAALQNTPTHFRLSHIWAFTSWVSGIFVKNPRAKKNAALVRVKVIL